MICSRERRKDLPGIPLRLLRKRRCAEYTGHLKKAWDRLRLWPVPLFSHVLSFAFWLGSKYLSPGEDEGKEVKDVEKDSQSDGPGGGLLFRV